MKRSIESASRIEKAIQLRAAGYTYQQIADACGYANRGIAHLTIHRELKRRVDKHVDVLRAEELEMLDALHRELWPLAFPGNGRRPRLAAFDKLLRLSHQRCLLLGLYPKPGRREVPAGYTKVIIREAQTSGQENACTS